MALVVADTFEQATAAARLVKVTYQAEAGLYDLEANRKFAYPPASVIAGKRRFRASATSIRALPRAPPRSTPTYTTPYQSS